MKYPPLHVPLPWLQFAKPRYCPVPEMTFVIAPLLAPTLFPASSVEPLQVPLAAAVIAARASVALGCPVPPTLIQAAVLVFELLTYKMGWPHPCEPKFPAVWKGHWVTPIGKRHEVGGIVAGGAEIAVACAPVAKLLSPSSLRKNVGTEDEYRHRTALTNLPSR